MYNCYYLHPVVYSASVLGTHLSFAKNRANPYPVYHSSQLFEQQLPATH